MLISLAVLVYKAIPLSSTDTYPTITPKAPDPVEFLHHGWWVVSRDCSTNQAREASWPQVDSKVEARLLFKDGEHFLDIPSLEDLDLVPLSVLDGDKRVRCFNPVAPPTHAPETVAPSFDPTLPPTAKNEEEENESLIEEVEDEDASGSMKGDGGGGLNVVGVEQNVDEGEAEGVEHGQKEGTMLDECCSGCAGFFDKVGSWVNCPGFKWQSKGSACEALKGMNLLMLGDSTMRRLYYTVSGLLKGSRAAAQHVLDTRPVLEQRFDQRVADKSVKTFIGGPSPKWRYSTEGCDGTVNVTYKFVSYGSKTKLYLRDVVFPNNTQPMTVVFSIGIYNLVKDKLLSKGKKGFNRVVDMVNSNELHPELYQWVWKTPAPVNQSHVRFSNLTQPANEQLQVFADWSVKKAQTKGLYAVDTFTPFVAIKNLSPYKLMLWESGQEWIPNQHGGIHMLDDGRRLQCQLLLNKLIALKRRKREPNSE